MNKPINKKENSITRSDKIQNPKRPTIISNLQSQSPSNSQNKTMIDSK